MTRICLVSHNASGAFRGDDSGHIGGVERQTGMLARYLVDCGHDVFVVTWMDGDIQDWTDGHGVNILGTCGPDAGIRGIRFISPRWTSLAAALRRADADVYYHNAAEVETGQIALWCRLNRKPFVYAVASEPACERRLPSLNGFTEKTFYKAGLRSATTVIAQTVAQQSKLQSEFERPSLVLPMPCQVPERPLARPNKIDELPLRVVWVGRLVPLKRLDMLLDAAQRLPDVAFAVIAPENKETIYSRDLVERASSMSNVQFTGRLNFDEVWRHYCRASLLVCTSEYEGFPNTFLEAMACQLPIVSTFDPDGSIGEFRLGAAVSDGSELIAALKKLQATPSKLLEYSANAIQFFNRYHRADIALPRFEQAIVGAVSQ